MYETNVEYASGGRVFSGTLVDPGVPAPRPGILVLHGGAGRGAHEGERSRMLAELGYVAFAPDLFGEAFASRARGVEVITALVEQPATLRARLGDALAFLRGQGSVDPERTAAIGFCFGGLAALELARSGASLRSVVSFHGGLTARAPAEKGRVQAAVLVCTGAADPFVSREHRCALEEEMTAAGADWQMHVYAGAAHAFTVRDVAMPGCGYHEPSDRRSWRSMCALFEETLGQ
jgi:dienelactone hydrolase